MAGPRKDSHNTLWGLTGSGQVVPAGSGTTCHVPAAKHKTLTMHTETAGSPPGGGINPASDHYNNGTINRLMDNYSKTATNMDVDMGMLPFTGR